MAKKKPLEQEDKPASFMHRSRLGSHAKRQRFCGASSLLGLLICSMVLGCAGKQTTLESAPASLGVPVTLASAFYAPGEQLKFRFSLRGIEGGEAVVVSGNPGIAEGRRVLIIRSRFETAGVVEMFKKVRDDVTSWIDLETGYPVYSRADLKFGAKESVIETKFAEGKPGSFSIDYHRSGRRAVRLRQQLTKDETVFDSHSSLAVMRGWQSVKGAGTTFYVLAGRRLWKNSIKHAGTEVLDTEFGKLRAVRIEGIAQRLTRGMKVDKRKTPREFTLWVSDDSRRLPVLAVGKTEYGDIRAELVTHRQSPRAMSRRR